jgi:hypothetical protein
MHYCFGHQGNHSHYDEGNCDLCKARAEVEALKIKLAGLQSPPQPPEIADEPAGALPVMSRRDYFAAAALTGLLGDSNVSEEFAAKFAVQVADQIIAELDGTAITREEFII